MHSLRQVGDDIRIGLFLQHHSNRIAWNDLQHHEDQKHDAHQNGDGNQDSFDNVRKHVYTSLKSCVTQPAGCFR